MFGRNPADMAAMHGPSPSTFVPGKSCAYSSWHRLCAGAQYDGWCGAGCKMLAGDLPRESLLSAPAAAKEASWHNNSSDIKSTTTHVCQLAGTHVNADDAATGCETHAAYVSSYLCCWLLFKLFFNISCTENRCAKRPRGCPRACPGPLARALRSAPLRYRRYAAGLAADVPLDWH